MGAGQAVWQHEVEGQQTARLTDAVRLAQLRLPDGQRRAVKAVLARCDAAPVHLAQPELVTARQVGRRLHSHLLHVRENRSGSIICLRKGHVVQ